MLHDLSWNKHDPYRRGGPDHKTVQKILDGLRVREDVFTKLATALSSGGKPVSPCDIPRD